MGTAIKHPVPVQVKPSFAIFDIWALRRSFAFGLCKNSTTTEVHRWEIARKPGGPVVAQKTCTGVNRNASYKEPVNSVQTQKVIETLVYSLQDAHRRPTSDDR